MNRDAQLAGAYDDAAPYYDSWRWQCVWTAQEEPRLRRRVHALAPRRALDLGTGTGRYARVLADAGAEVIGLDVSEAMLARARKRCPAARFLQRSALDLADLGPFDLVLGARMVCHLPDIDAALAAFVQVLRPGGTLLLTDIDPDHAVECTYLPTADGYVPVPTWKRSLAEVAHAACRAGPAPRQGRRYGTTPAMRASFPFLPVSAPHQALFWMGEFTRPEG